MRPFDSAQGERNTPLLGMERSYFTTRFKGWYDGKNGGDGGSEGIQAGFSDGDCFGFVEGWDVEGDFVEVFAGGGEHGASAGFRGSAAVSSAEGADGARLSDEGGVDGVEDYEDPGPGAEEWRPTLISRFLEALRLEVFQVGHWLSGGGVAE